MTILVPIMTKQIVCTGKCLAARSDVNDWNAHGPVSGLRVGVASLIEQSPSILLLYEFA